MAGSGPVLLLFRIEAIITFYEKAPPIRRLEVQTGTEKYIRTMRLTTPFHPNIIAYTEKFRYIIFKQQVGLNADMLGEITKQGEDFGLTVKIERRYAWGDNEIDCSREGELFQGRLFSAGLSTLQTLLSLSRQMHWICRHRASEMPTWHSHLIGNAVLHWW